MRKFSVSLWILFCSFTSVFKGIRFVRTTPKELGKKIVRKNKKLSGEKIWTWKRKKITSFFLFWQSGKVFQKNWYDFAKMFIVFPMNTAECERGLSRKNLLKAKNRNRLKTLTIDHLMRVSMTPNLDFYSILQWIVIKSKITFYFIPEQ